MKNKMYKEYFSNEESYIKNKNRSDKKIELYENKFMNNAKWKRIFLAIFSNTHCIKKCEIIDFFSNATITLKTNLQNIEPENYIFSDCIDNFLFETGEYAVSYREIEYIEFKKCWKGNSIGMLIEPKTMEQDINKIKEVLSKIGKFEWDETEEYLRIKGYE
jgi:hypothetical protein